jgi:hypothetical protein
VMVPVGAVRNEGGVSKLFVAKGDRAEVRIVHVGREASGGLEILRGLATGESVVSPQVIELTDGAPIAVSQGVK